MGPWSAASFRSNGVSPELSRRRPAGQALSDRYDSLRCFVSPLSSGTGSSLSPRLFFHKTSSTAATPATGYALEKPAPSNKSNTGLGSFFRSGPTIEQRRVANAREFERLAIKDKELKLRKRDLLRSDVEGNSAFARDLTEYTVALAKANAEKNELAKPPQ